MTMNSTKKTVMSLITDSLADGNNNTESVEVREKEGKGNAENRPRKKSAILHSLSMILLHALDALLLIILLPFIIWQWISDSERLKIILKAVAEVSLELIMWVIFAGVSILITTTFVLEDIYFGKNEHEKLKNSMNQRGEQQSTTSGNGTQNVSKEHQENPKISGN